MVDRKQIQRKLGTTSNLLHDIKQEKNSLLPYENLVTKNLEETWYDFGDEEFMEKTIIIETFVLPSMK